MTRHDSNDLSHSLNARISELMRELCPGDEAMQNPSRRVPGGEAV